MNEQHLQAQNEAWSTLHTLKRNWAERKTHMRDLFKTDPNRFNDLHIKYENILYDFSKQTIDNEIFDALINLAQTSDLDAKRTAMLQGAPINHTENRAALHMALRSPCDPDITIDGENVAQFAANLKTQIRDISTQIRSSKTITDIIHIGVGGSNLGPELVTQALSHHHTGQRIHFVSNIDGQTVQTLCDTLRPEKTAILIASKSFTTLETSTAANHIKHWLSQHLPAQSLPNHLYAMTARPTRAQEFGVPENHILPMRDWVGGRFSLWSSIGLPIAIALGYDIFSDLLKGAAIADTHFITAPLHENIPVIMALIGIWNRNICGHNGYALLAYADALRTMPQYMQQLDMESNGKASPHKTAPIVLGGVGTGAQHAFMQSIHQSAEIIPCDFLIAAHNPRAPKHFQDALNANALAQSEALMKGAPNEAEPHRHFAGNRPSSTIMLPEITPRALGQLLATFEHKITAQGFIWDINSFDQFGVELGKTLATTIQADLQSGTIKKAHDASTHGLLKAIIDADKS